MHLPGLNLAIRTLRRNPGFTVPALLTLALGIGVNTAMFSIVDAMMLRPLPFRDPDRLAHVWTQRDDIPVLKGRKLDADAAQVERWAQLSRSFDSIGGYRAWRVSVGGAGEPERSEERRVG